MLYSSILLVCSACSRCILTNSPLILARTRSSGRGVRPSFSPLADDRRRCCWDDSAALRWRSLRSWKEEDLRADERPSRTGGPGRCRGPGGSAAGVIPPPPPPPPRAPPPPSRELRTDMPGQLFVGVLQRMNKISVGVRIEIKEMPSTFPGCVRFSRGGGERK